MKTPIQKLIEELEIMRDKSDGHTAEVEAYTKAIDLANYFISEQLSRKSCHHACSPSDFYNGGKCDIMGCYKD